MGSIKISELTAKTTPVGTEETVVNDSGTSKKIALSNITQENFTTTLKTKLDGIETGATADQTGAEIKTAYELEADTNAFTDADHSKLDGIEAGATADQTGAEIKTAYEGELNTNAYTDAEKTKLAGIADSANNYVHPTGAGNEHLPATVSQTEAGYLDGVTSAIQTQLDGKSATSHNHTGVYEPADATIVKDADIGVTVQAYDADTAKTDTTQTWTANQTFSSIYTTGNSGIGTSTVNATLQLKNKVDTNGYDAAHLRIYEDGAYIYGLGITSGTFNLRTDQNFDVYTGTTKRFNVSTTGVDVTGRAKGTLTTDNDGSFDMNASNNFKCTPTANFTLTFTNIVSQSGFILLVNTGGHTVSAAATTKVDANALATISTAGTYLVSYFSDGTNVYITNSQAYT